MASKYPQRKIGDDLVSAQGLGCMGMSFGYTSYGGYNDEESLKVLTKAADLGITFVRNFLSNLSTFHVLWGKNTSYFVRIYC
jgi:hypothetical protein